jgi:hypothetical protein
MIHSDPSSHLRLGLPSGLFRTGFTTKALYTFLSSPMPCPLHSPWLDLPNDIWEWVQIMKFLILQLSSFSRHIIPLRSKYSSQTLSVYARPLVWETKFRTHTKNWHNYVFFFIFLTFTFLDSRQDDKRLWTEWLQAFPEFSLLLISSWIQFWSLNVAKYLNFATS